MKLSTILIVFLVGIICRSVNSEYGLKKTQAMHWLLCRYIVNYLSEPDYCTSVGFFTLTTKTIPIQKEYAMNGYEYEINSKFWLESERSNQIDGVLEQLLNRIKSVADTSSGKDLETDIYRDYRPSTIHGNPRAINRMKRETNRGFGYGNRGGYDGGGYGGYDYGDGDYGFGGMGHGHGGGRGHSCECGHSGEVDDISKLLSSLYTLF